MDYIGRDMIQIIEGASGSGKSYTIYQELIQASLKMPEKQFFFLVPEQFTMQAQRDIVTMHPHHGTMNIDIVSFNRLAYRIFEELNIHCEHVLEDFGKSMLLQRILMEHRKELPIFGTNLNKVGFIDELKSLLTELFQYRIGREDIVKVYESMTEASMLKRKLHDVLYVYDAFEKEVEGNYIIAEHMLEMLAMHIPESQLLQDSVIYMDGFTGFTPIQYEVLEALAQVSEALTVTVTIDKQSVEKETCEEHALFYLSKDTILRIRKLAERLNLYVEERFIEGEKNRFSQASELKHLEENLFRYPYAVWKEPVNQIHIQAMRTPRQEFHHVARQVRSLVRNGYRYRDIAIIHGNLEAIELFAEEILPKLHIPYFIDTNQSIYMNPCLEAIRAILEIAIQDYSYESVFRFLKTGVTEFHGELLEQLENYVLQKGIRGISWWKKAFASDIELEEIQETNKLRGLTEEQVQVLLCGQQVLQFLEPFVQALQKAEQVQEYVSALEDFLNHLDMVQQLEEAADSFEVVGNLVQAKAYRQIPEKLESIWEKMKSILGSKEMKLEEFQSLLETGLDEISLGVIPPSLDQITIGDIERTRLNHIKVLFVMGVNDGIIPRITKGGGILSEADRKCLEESLELAPDSRSRVFTEQFYLYQNLTKESEGLYLTYHVQDSDGNETIPAYVIGRVKKLFPTMETEDWTGNEIGWDSLETSSDSMEVLTAGLQKEDGWSTEKADIWKTLFDYYYENQPEVIERIQKGWFYHNLDSQITQETAKRLYGNILNASVSRLETYSRCPYRFFLEYGLGLRKREINEVSLADMGSLLHHVVEQVFSRVENRKAAELMLSDEGSSVWDTVEDATLVQMVEEAVRAHVEEEPDSVYLYSNANKQLLHRIQKTAEYAVVNLKQQLLQGKMIPYRFEMDFNRRNSEDACKDLTATNIQLEQDARMQLSGVIDRIDICQDEEHVYVKVLDYKSSGKDIETGQVAAGLQLQLLVYTNVAMEVLQRQFPNKKIIPAGSLYYGFRLPMVEKTAQKITDGLTRKIHKETAMTGVVNKEEPCISLLGDIESLPVKMKEIDGEKVITESETVVDGAKYQDLLNEAKGMATNIGNQVLQGEIPIRPVKIGRGIVCDYCDYKDVCKLDCIDGGNQIYTVEQLAIQQKGGGNHAMDKGTTDNH